jgi:hypothetical protein
MSLATRKQSQIPVENGSFPSSECAHGIWILKGLKGLPFFVLVIFFWQKQLITLQRLQTSSILSWVVTKGLTIS